MASFAALLSTCLFFVCSLATPCVHDEVAMFQGKLHVRSHQHLMAHRTASLSLENTRATGTSILQDADNEIQKMKDFLYDLELQNPMTQAGTLTQIANWLPKVEATDKGVRAFTANISSASWDWVDKAYNTHGSMNEGLHEAAKVIDVLGMLPTAEGSAMDKLKDMASKIVNTGDKMVNGMAETTDEMRWQAGNTSLSTMKATLQKLIDGKAVFDEEVELYKKTLASVGATAWVTPMVKDSAMKAPDAVRKLHDDYIEAYQSYVSPFEQEFESFDITKERRAKEKAEADAAAAKKAFEDGVAATKKAMEDTGDAIKEVQETVQDALEPVTDVLKAMADMKKKMQNASMSQGGKPASKPSKPMAKPVTAKPPASPHQQPKMPMRR